jgi:flagellar protein FliO/FliZ
VTDKSFRFVLVSVLAVPSFALAQDADKGRDVLASPVDVSTLLGLAASLVVVIGAILLAGWAYSRLRGVSTGASRVINVLAAQSLGPKERIVLVQIGGKQLAVGLTPGSLNTLHVFDEPVIEVAEKRQSAPFAEKLRVAFAKAGTP